MQISRKELGLSPLPYDEITDKFIAEMRAKKRTERPVLTRDDADRLSTILKDFVSYQSPEGLYHMITPPHLRPPQDLPDFSKQKKRKKKPVDKMRKKFPLVTPAEYLAQEQTAFARSEYIAGEVLPKREGSRDPYTLTNHDMLAVDTLLAINKHIFPLEVNGIYEDNQIVRCAEEGPFFYPDVSVVFDAPIIDGDNCLRNPALVVEVFSKATAAFDCREKFRCYRTAPTLRHYFLIDSVRMFVAYYRQKEGIIWELAGEYTKPEEYIVLPEYDLWIPLSDIYRRVTFRLI